MKFMWVLIPFCMLGGAFLQGIGFYLLVVFGALWQLRGQIETGRMRQLVLGSWAWIGCFYLFPLFNALSYWTRDPRVLPELIYAMWPLDFIFKSPVSSVMGMSSLVFILIYYALQAKVPKHQIKWSKQEILQLFHKGLLWAGLILLGYSLLQSLTGLDVREPGFLLSEQKKLLTGNYRTIGFYGHVLSLASVSLALFVFYLHLFLSQPQKPLWSGWRRVQESPWVYGYIAGVFFLILLLTGSRAPVSVALGFLFLMSFYSLIRNGFKILNLWRAFLSLVGIGCIAWAVGLFVRFHEMWQLWQNQGLHRFKFWAVYHEMFWDRPWIGQGYVLIRKYLRYHYYERMGFGQLETQYNAHNIYLEILATVGGVGFVILIGLIALWLVRFCKALALDPITKPYARAFALAFAANLVHGISQNTLFDSNLNFVYWTLVWLLMWVYTMKDPSENEQASEHHVMERQWHPSRIEKGLS